MTLNLIAKLLTMSKLEIKEAMKATDNPKFLKILQDTLAYRISKRKG